MTDEKSWKELVQAWAVTTETHTKIICTCPECGATFDKWLQNILASDPMLRQMEEQTTDCTFCHEEWLARDEEDEEPSFPAETPQ